MIRVVTLMENTKGVPGCHFEHGLSFYIETPRHRLLFDFGASDKTLENAHTLGIPLELVDLAFLSHGHYDHSGALLSFQEMNARAPILIQKNALLPHYSIRGDLQRAIGIDPQIPTRPQVRLLNGNLRIDEELELFTGITGRRFFARDNENLKTEADSNLIQDDFSHEQCLRICADGAEILFSGCSHNGILNILDEYHRLYQRYPDYVFGGFHTMQKNGYTDKDLDIIRKTARELRSHNTVYYTGHCTGPVALEEMKNILGHQLKELHTGSEILIQFHKN